MRYARLGACLMLMGCVEPAPLPRDAATAIVLPPPASSAPGLVTPQRTTDAWAQELEWARSRFPVLRDFVADVSFQPVLDWVPVGKTTTIYLRAAFTDSHQNHFSYDCDAAEAVRSGEAGEDDAIRMVLPGPERVERGTAVRDYVTAHASKRGLSILGAGGKQRKRPDGTWEAFDVYATSAHELGAFVGPIRGAAAYFQYVPVEIRASCGPREEVPCGGGRRQLCNRCETVEIALESPRVPRRPSPPAPSACTEPCPAVENPELDRILRLAQHVPIGLAPSTHDFGVALYRSLQACRTDASWRSP